MALMWTIMTNSLPIKLLYSQANFQWVTTRKPECTLHMHNIMNKYRKKVYYKLHDDQHDFFYLYIVFPW